MSKNRQTNSNYVAVKKFEPVLAKSLEVQVTDKGGLERAIKQFKRKVAGEGILREAKERGSYDKPSIKRRKKQIAAAKQRSKDRRQAQGK